MTAVGWLQIAVLVGLVLGLAVPVGLYLARVLEGEAVGERFLARIEDLVYRAAGVDPGSPMDWRGWTFAVLVFNGLGALFVYVVQRAQAFLPLNPEAMRAVTPDSSFDTAISFVTNTDWQGYGGESTMSYLTQSLALTVQNFVSAATGIAVMAALARGFARRETTDLGNFWVDLLRITTRLLVPLSLAMALILVSQGVVQTFGPAVHVSPLDPSAGMAEQVLAVGPAASQIAIKQLGTNGGGFFNTNASHPFENPTPLSNTLEVLAILLIPAACCVTFGRMVRDLRQGWALLAAMTVVLVPMLVLTALAEAHGTPLLQALGVEGGNYEGKEVRFGIAGSASWAVFTTAASNGSVNAMHDSFTPLGGLIPMWLMQLGEVVFGGVGSGLYGMWLFVIVAVFVAGLMVGRTPEVLGKKVEAFEMQMASIGILVPAATVLVGTALAVSVAAGTEAVFDRGSPHGFSEVLYAFSSAANNNGSAFAGLAANNPFYNTALGVAMFLGRYLVMVPVLAIAGSMARKRAVAIGPGTLPTHTPLFVVLLVGVVVVVGALTYLPALALGPLAEQLAEVP